MIWPILAAVLYAITCAIALHLICSAEERDNPLEIRKDAYFDVRNIGVALFWPGVLIGWGVWAAGKRIFKEKTKTVDNGTANK
jgi:hypothetical protein